jgi:hypothetical protein
VDTVATFTTVPLVDAGILVLEWSTA